MPVPVSSNHPSGGSLELGTGHWELLKTHMPTDFKLPDLGENVTAATSCGSRETGDTIEKSSRSSSSKPTRRPRSAVERRGTGQGRPGEAGDRTSRQVSTSGRRGAAKAQSPKRRRQPRRRRRRGLEAQRRRPVRDEAAEQAAPGKRPVRRQQRGRRASWRSRRDSGGRHPMRRKPPPPVTTRLSRGRRRSKPKRGGRRHQPWRA